MTPAPLQTKPKSRGENYQKTKKPLSPKTEGHRGTTNSLILVYVLQIAMPSLKENHTLKITIVMCTHSNSLTHNKSMALGVVCSLSSVIGCHWLYCVWPVTISLCSLPSASKAVEFGMDRGQLSPVY